MKKILLINVMAALAAAVSLYAAEGDGIWSYTMPTAKASVKLDGRLDEPCWKAPPMLTWFRPLRKPLGAIPGTKVWLTQDNDALYLAAECLEPDMRYLKTQAKRHDGPTWEDDAIELFLNPSGDRRGYVQIVVNAAGVIMDGIKDNYPTGTQDNLWESGATAAVRRSSDRWCLELRVPFAALPLGAPGTDWTFHVTRDRQAGEPILLSSLHSQEDFFGCPPAFDTLKGVKPSAGSHLHLVSFDIGDCLTGLNRASFTFKNLGVKPENVTLETDWPVDQAKSSDITVQPGQQATVSLDWKLSEHPAADNIRFILRQGARTLRTFNRHITPVPPIGELPCSVFLFNTATPVVINFPVNIASLSHGDGGLTWELWDSKANKRLTDGFTAVTSKNIVIRVFWTFPYEGTFSLRRWLKVGDDSFYREDAVRFVIGPWKD